jgi:quinoprotein glucose dehydrogenase
MTLLGHANQHVRAAAQKRAVDLGAKAVEPLKALAANAEAPLLGRIHAVWALGQLAINSPKISEAVAQYCTDKNPEVRAQAARALGWAAHSDAKQRAGSGAVLTKLLNDDSPRVRSLAAIAIGRLRYDGALAALVKQAEADGEDPTLRHSLALAMAGGNSPEQLVTAAQGAGDLQRLVLAVALGKQRSPLIAKMLQDKSERVVLEAARIIWDAPVPAANASLAALIKTTNSQSNPLLRRVLAANLAGRSTEQLEDVINFAMRDDVTPELRDLAWELVRNWAAPSARDSVNGDWRALEKRPAEEVAAALQKPLPKLKAAGAKNPLGLIVAAELGVQDAYSPLLALMSDDSLSDALRIRALNAFGKAQDDLVHQAIAMGVKSAKPQLRSAARKLWSDRFPNEVVEQLSETMTAGTMQEQQAAMDTLAGLTSPKAQEVVRSWMNRLASGDCPAELQLEVLDAAGRSTDPAVVEQQKSFLAKLAGGSPTDKFANCVAGGDAERGRKIFETNETFACRRCHSVKPKEVLVGPCLATVGSQRKPAEILESIVAPNAKICEGFETAVLELDSGNVVTGVVRREDKSVIELVDAQAKAIVIDVATVENRLKGKSPMPENLMDQMKPRELRDLVAYLSELKEPQPAKRPRRGKR